MILGLIGMALANAATVLGARWLQARISSGKPAVDFLLFLLLRALLISAAVLAAGLLQVLTPLGLGLAGATVLALLLLAGAHRGLPRPGPLPWNGLLVAAALLVLLKLLAQVWFFAPYAGDVVTYHLPKIGEWIRAGGFSRELGLNPRVTLPAGFELLETWWVVFLHHDVLIEMAGVEMLLLAASAVYVLARELQLSPSCAFGAALLFALTPGLQVEATSTMNDVAATALTLATAALIVARVDPLLTLMAVAMGAGIKPTTLYALPGVILLAFLVRRAPLMRAERRPIAWGTAGLAVAVGASWYWRNLLWFGNPVFPMGTELGRQVQQVGPSALSLKENLLALVDVRVYDHFPVGALHTGNANWGAVAFACGIPALIVWVRDDGHVRRMALGFTVSALSILALVTMDAWNMRFILFVPALPAIAAARVAGLHRPILALVGAAALFCFLSSLLPSEIGSPGRLVKVGWRERSARPAPPLAAQGEALGALGDDLVGAYWLYDPDYSRRVAYLRETTAPALLERMDRENLRVLYVSPRAEESAMIREAVSAGRLERVLDGFGPGYRKIR